MSAQPAAVAAAPAAATPVEGKPRRNTTELTARLAAAVAEAEGLEAQGRYREAAELTALAMAEVTQTRIVHCRLSERLGRRAVVRGACSHWHDAEPLTTTRRTRSTCSSTAKPARTRPSRLRTTSSDTRRGGTLTPSPSPNSSANPDPNPNSRGCGLTGASGNPPALEPVRRAARRRWLSPRAAPRSPPPRSPASPPPPPPLGPLAARRRARTLTPGIQKRSRRPGPRFCRRTPAGARPRPPAPGRPRANPRRRSRLRTCVPTGGRSRSRSRAQRCRARPRRPSTRTRSARCPR